MRPCVRAHMMDGCTTPHLHKRRVYGQPCRVAAGPAKRPLGKVGVAEVERRSVGARPGVCKERERGREPRGGRAPAGRAAASACLQASRLMLRVTGVHDCWQAPDAKSRSDLSLLTVLPVRPVAVPGLVKHARVVVDSQHVAVARAVADAAAGVGALDGRIGREGVAAAAPGDACGANLKGRGRRRRATDRSGQQELDATAAIKPAAGRQSSSCSDSRRQHARSIPSLNRAPALRSDSPGYILKIVGPRANGCFLRGLLSTRLKGILRGPRGRPREAGISEGFACFMCGAVVRAQFGIAGQLRQERPAPAVSLGSPASWPFPRAARRVARAARTHTGWCRRRRPPSRQSLRAAPCSGSHRLCS